MLKKYKKYKRQKSLLGEVKKTRQGSIKMADETEIFLLTQQAPEPQTVWVIVSLAQLQ